MSERRDRQIFLIAQTRDGWAVCNGADVLAAFATRAAAKDHAARLVELAQVHGETAEICDPYGEAAMDEPVLVVDDDPIIAMVTKDALEARGFAVVSAGSAPEAVRIMSEPRSWSGLVTDIDLGPGGDGFDVARAARERHPDLRVVFISGAEQGRYSVHGVKPSLFIAKPFDPRRVAEALHQAS